MSFLKNFMTQNNPNSRAGLTTGQEKLKLVTHDGSFHADDIFAAATLILFLEKTSNDFSAQGGPVSGWEIIRTRDPEIINTGDYVFDVGGVYDEANNRFDHHQKGGAGKRDNGIEYSSFGLVWKKYGKELTRSDEAMELIDKRLASPVDAHDNGLDLVKKKYEISPYLIQDFFRVMRPTWRETDLKVDEMFLKSVEIAKEILSREIIYALDTEFANKVILSIYQNTEDKKIIVLDKNYPSSEILNKLPKTLFLVYPRDTNNYWGVKAVRQDFKSFKNKKDLPKNWAGLRDRELANISGVSDAVFCHRALFMAVAKTKEGAIKLAQIAIESR